MTTKLSRIELNGNKRVMQEAREVIGRGYSFGRRIEEFGPEREWLWQTSFGEIDRLIKDGHSLTFEQAYAGMVFALAAANASCLDYLRALAPADQTQRFSDKKVEAAAFGFLQLLATKQALARLTVDEVAGMAAATQLDTVARFHFPEVIETCGTGKDSGFLRGSKRRKTINASTLSALTLSACGLPVVKHGSYANTSETGSTDFMERFGAKIDHRSLDEVRETWEALHFCYLDAHWCKTVHDLSHLLMIETINHVVGPLSPPLDRETIIHKVMGVNDRLPPQTVARAYALLCKRGYQRNGGVAIVAGLDVCDVDAFDDSEVRRHTILDELSPFASVVALTRGDQYLGSFLVRPSDFGVAIEASDIIVERGEAMVANEAALCGQSHPLVDYLAMNAALGNFVMKYLSREDALTGGVLNKLYLRLAFEECREAIVSGEAQGKLEAYIVATGGKIVRP